MIWGPKLSNFKIGWPKLQNDENKGIKTAIKPKVYLDLGPKQNYNQTCAISHNSFP
jgi:hypothetical protein